MPRRIGQVSLDSAILASVVPSRNEAVAALIAKTYGTKTRIVGRDLPLCVDIRCDEPGKVGVDRLLNAVAAHARTKRGAVVVDVGTAITVNAVADDGAFLGGAIAPGRETMLHALHRRTESLPQVDLRQPKAAIGKNTADAMRSGVYWGTIGLIESLVRRVAAELRGDPPVFLTGGGADAIVSQLSIPIQHVPFLTLEGLNVIVTRNTCEP